MLPIHPQLIELGLLKLVALRRKAGHIRLFPFIDRGKVKGTFPSNFSKCFAYYRRTNECYWPGLAFPCPSHDVPPRPSGGRQIERHSLPPHGTHLYRRGRPLLWPESGSRETRRADEVCRGRYSDHQQAFRHTLCRRQRAGEGTWAASRRLAPSPPVKGPWSTETIEPVTWTAQVGASPRNRAGTAHFIQMPLSERKKAADDHGQANNGKPPFVESSRPT